MLLQSELLFLFHCLSLFIFFQSAIIYNLKCSRLTLHQKNDPIILQFQTYHQKPTEFQILQVIPLIILYVLHSLVTEQ